jgi:hypothetical protein
MKRDLQIIRAVAIQADALRGESEKMGHAAAEAIRDSVGSRQIKGLENVADAALKVSDVLDYLKRQTAKCEPNKSWRKNNLGADLIQFVSSDLRQRATTVARTLNATEVERQRIHLLLIRSFIHQLAAHYEFARSGVVEGR